MINDMAEMLEQTGVKNVRTYDNGYFPGMGIHEMGTARMGNDPKTSVLNSHNQVWDAPNVFVTDGSCMTSRRLPESVAHVHGAHRARGGLRRERAQSPQPLTRANRHDIDDRRQIRLINRREAIRRVSALLGGVAFVGGSESARRVREGAPARRTAGAGQSSAPRISHFSTRSPTRFCRKRRRPARRRRRPARSWRSWSPTCYSPAEQKIFRDGMKKVDDARKKANNVVFHAGDAAAAARRADGARSRSRRRVMDARDAAERRKKGLAPVAVAAKQLPGGAARRTRTCRTSERRTRPARTPAPPRRSRRRAGALLPHDEGARAARLLHVGDRLHESDALRREPRALRSVHSVQAGRARVGGACLTPSTQGARSLGVSFRLGSVVAALALLISPSVAAGGRTKRRGGHRVSHDRLHLRRVA